MRPALTLLMFIAALAADGAGAQSQEEIFNKVFGNKAAAERALDAELEVDGYARESVAIKIKGKALLTVDLTQLNERLVDLLDDPTAACLAAKASAPDVLSEAAACGVDLRYDPATLKLVADVPAEHRREQRLAVRAPRTLAAPSASDAQLSAYLNLSAALRRLDNGRGIDSSEALGLDGAVRWRGSTFEFDAICAPGGCTPGLRSLVVDQPQTLRRWRVGDLPDAHAGSIGLPSLRGIGVGTAFELAPAQSYTPDLDAPLELNAPASVEVLVNNRIVQRFQLPAGRYSVRDFPLSFGANDAQLRITDAAGRQQTRTLEAYVDLALLDEDRSRYGLALGQPPLALDDQGTPVQPWVASAEYARGIGPRTTLAVAAASIPALQRHALELDLTQAIANWLFGVDLGCSIGQARGCRANLRFRRGGDPRSARPGWQFEGVAALRQASYADLLGAAADGDSASLLLRATRNLSDRYSLALGLRDSWNRAAGNRGTASIQLGGRLGAGLGFRVGVERDDGGALPADTRVTLSLSLQFDQARQSLQLDSESTDALHAARWQLNRGGMRGGYDATLGVADSDSASTQDAAASYRQERYGVDLSWSRFAPTAGLAASDTRAVVRSALVYADGQFGISERVLGSFAIVAPADPAAAGTVYVNPVDDDYLASSLGPGPAVVPGLRAYEPRALVLVMPELAPDHDPGELFPVVLPGYKGGVVIHAGGGATIRLQARILDADGAPLEMLSGRLEAEAGGTPIPVFAGRAGRLRAGGLHPGRWTLILDTHPARRHALILPAAAQGVVDVGDLKP